MAFLNLLLSSTSLFLLANAREIPINYSETNSTSFATQDLPTHIIPEHYDISMTIRPYEDIEIDGECKIFINIYHPTLNISLHVKSQVGISEVMLIQIKFRDVYVPENYTYNNENGICVFHFPDKLLPGRYMLNIVFVSLRDNTGIGFSRTSYRDDEGREKSVIATHFQAIGARHMFPCWDEPALKATFNISIRHYSDYMVLSNMPIRHQYQMHKMMWTYFHNSPVISTYLVAVMLCNFPNISVSKTTMKYRQQLEPYVTYAKNVIMNFTQYWERDLEILSKVDLVAVPNFIHDNVQNWGLIFCGETAIIYDKNLHSFGHQMNVASLVARSMAYQWSGNLVSPFWWTHAWLNEGIATLMGMKVIHKIMPFFRIWELFVVQIQQESLRLDTHDIMKPLMFKINLTSEINSLFTFSYYIKAPAILRMLEHFMTEKVFQIGVTNYLNKHKFGSATVNDFYTVMQHTLDISNEISFNIKTLLSAWTQNTHYPVVNVIKDYESNGTKIIQQENTTFDKMWVPITFTTRKNSDFNKTSLMYTIAVPAIVDFPSNKTIDEDEWIIVNLQQSGYYRVNYNTKIWLKIANYLNSVEYTRIPAVNRAQIIDDAYHFLMKGQLHLYTFIQLIKYLPKETDYVAWYPMFKAIEDMSSFYPFPESTYIKRKIFMLLNKSFWKIAYIDFFKNTTTQRIYDFNPKQTLHDCLKEEISKWACIEGTYRRCRRDAKSELRLFLEKNRQSHRVLPYWKEWIYCKGLIEAGDNLWNKVYNIYTEESDNILLKYLICSEDPNVIINYINQIASKDLNKYTKINYLLNIFLSIIAKHVKNDLILEYILENFINIKPSEVNIFVILTIIINNLYSKEQLDKITAFMEKEKETGFTIKHTFFTQRMLFNEVNKCRKTVANEIFKLPDLFITRKIQTRMSEIMSQKYYFRKFIKR